MIETLKQTIEGSLHIRWANYEQPADTPRFDILFSRCAGFKNGAQPKNEKVGTDALQSYLLELGFIPEETQEWIKHVFEKLSARIDNVFLTERQAAIYVP